MRNQPTKQAKSEEPLTYWEKISAIFILLATLDLFTPPGFWHDFVAFVCFLGAVISIFTLLRQNQCSQGSRKWYLALFAIYGFCCFSAFVFMLVDIKVMETIANLLATFQ